MQVEIRVLILDITKHCIQVPPEIERIYEVHLFDAGIRTHLCELTPSAELHHVYTDFVPAETYTDISEERREELDAYLQDVEMDAESISYMHMSRAMKSSLVHLTEEIEEEDEREEFLETCVEQFMGNPGSAEIDKLLKNQNEKKEV